MKKQKILFIWGRAYIGKLFTMPFGLNVLWYLLQEGYEVEICLLEHASDKYHEILPGNPRIRFMGKLLSIGLNRIKYWRIAFRFIFRYRYKHIIAVGQMGAVAAGTIPGKNKNIAYFNDEFPSIFKNPFLMQREVALIQRASVVALPDMCRLEGLQEDIGYKIPEEKVVEFINSPCWIHSDTVQNINWHERLGIAAGKKIVLFSGGIAPYLQVTEMLMSVKLWDESFVLVMNSSSLDALNKFRQSVEHLHIEGRIIWMQEVLSEDAFHSLIAASFCNICLYSNINPNMYTVGKSSGKAMRSLLLGVPVICSRFPSFRFIEENNIGVCVDHPLEIVDALRHLGREHEAITANCRKYAREQMDTRQEYEHFKSIFFPVSQA